VDLYGPVVNLAFRLEEMTKAFGVGIVVSDEVAKQLRIADPRGVRWRLRTLGNVIPRGMKMPLGAYDLSPTSGMSGYSSWVTSDNYEMNLPLWDEAVGLFMQGEWADAASRFDDFFAEDPTAKCFLRHIKRTNGAPPADWKGSFTPRPEE
jgi:adenylate cyclase